MPRNLLIEGPDGSGKSTLIRQFTERFPVPVHPRACTSTGGPVDNLCDWAMNDIAEQDKNSGWLGADGHTPTTQLYDRHPGISELVYGPICRDKVAVGFDNWGNRDEILHGIQRNMFIIWCLPPAKVVANNVMKQVDNHMSGVASNISAIYSAYRLWTMIYHGGSFVYDYTNDSHAKIIEAIMAAELGILHD
jgi:GTPase SAR1 family protein